MTRVPISLCRLLGAVAAGTKDDREAVVVAGEMQPRSVQIADVKVKPSYWHRSGSAFGQIAYVNNLHPPSAEQVTPGGSRAAIVQVRSRAHIQYPTTFSNMLEKHI